MYSALPYATLKFVRCLVPEPTLFCLTRTESIYLLHYHIHPKGLFCILSCLSTIVLTEPPLDLLYTHGLTKHAVFPYDINSTLLVRLLYIKVTGSTHFVYVRIQLLA